MLLFVKKLLLHPPFEAARLERIKASAGTMAVVNAANPQEAAREIADATGFIGKITPELLARATRLEWVQSPADQTDRVSLLHVAKLKRAAGNVVWGQYDGPRNWG